MLLRLRELLLEARWKLLLEARRMICAHLSQPLKSDATPSRRPLGISSKVHSAEKPTP